MNVDRTGGALKDSVEDGGVSELMEVTARIEQTLRPVPPAPAFRARLRDGLLMAAHHQQAHRLLSGARNEPPWGWLIGAAALGSAAGVIAVVLRSRAQVHKDSAQPQLPQ